MTRLEAPVRSISTERLTAALDEVGGSGRPEYLNDIVAQASRTRQRPAWTFLERWLPVTIALRPAVVPRAYLTFIVLLAALLALLLAAFLFAGASPTPPISSLPQNGLLAFDAQTDIWVVNDDGTGLRQLTTTDQAETSPYWSPDGTRMAYWLRPTDDRVPGSIVVADVNGAIIRTLTPPPGLAFPPTAAAQWTPDGRSVVPIIVWEAGGTDDSHVSTSSIIVFDVDSGELHMIHVGIPPTLVRSTPGGRFAFGKGDDNVGLWVVDTNGQNLRQVDSTISTGQGSFTPDGGWYLAGADGPDDASATDLVAIAMDGSGVRTLVGGPTDDVSPAISPDGSQIAFARSESPNSAPYHLFLVPSNGGDAVSIDDQVDIEPRTGTWSPDGSRFATWTPDNEQIVIFDIDGGGAPVFVPSPSNQGRLTWQPLR